MKVQQHFHSLYKVRIVRTNSSSCRFLYPHKLVVDNEVIFLSNHIRIFHESVAVFFVLSSRVSSSKLFSDLVDSKTIFSNASGAQI